MPLDAQVNSLTKPWRCGLVIIERLKNGSIFLMDCFCVMEHRNWECSQKAIWNSDQNADYCISTTLGLSWLEELSSPNDIWLTLPVQVSVMYVTHENLPCFGNRMLGFQNGCETQQSTSLTPLLPSQVVRLRNFGMKRMMVKRLQLFFNVFR